MMGEHRGESEGDEALAGSAGQLLFGQVRRERKETDEIVTGRGGQAFSVWAVQPGP